MSADDAIGGYHAHALTWATPGLEGPWARKFIGALGLLADGLQEAAKQAVKLRFPGICPGDALDANGSTYGHPRYPYEGDDRYRSRLSFKWQTHEESGSKYGINRAFTAAGLPAFAYESWEWYDAQNPTIEWYRVWAVLGPNATRSTVSLWGDPGVWGDGGVWEDSRQKEIDILRAVLRQHKPAHVVISGIWVVYAGGYWGMPGDTWGQGPEDVWGGDVTQRFDFLPIVRGL
jgi:hypothetical protein